MDIKNTCVCVIFVSFIVFGSANHMNGTGTPRLLGFIIPGENGARPRLQLIPGAQRFLGQGRRIAAAPLSRLRQIGVNGLPGATRTSVRNVPFNPRSVVDTVRRVQTPPNGRSVAGVGSADGAASERQPNIMFVRPANANGGNMAGLSPDVLRQIRLALRNRGSGGSRGGAPSGPSGVTDTRSTSGSSSSSSTSSQSSSLDINAGAQRPRVQRPRTREELIAAIRRRVDSRDRGAVGAAGLPGTRVDEAVLNSGVRPATSIRVQGETLSSASTSSSSANSQSRSTSFNERNVEVKNERAQSSSSSSSSSSSDSVNFGIGSGTGSADIVGASQPMTGTIAKEAGVQTVPIVPAGTNTLITESGVEVVPVISQQPSIGREPFISQQPSIDRELVISQLPSIDRELVISQQPSIGRELIISQQPSIGRELVISQQPSIGRELVISQQPSIGREPVISMVADVAPIGPIAAQIPLAPTPPPTLPPTMPTLPPLTQILPRIRQTIQPMTLPTQPPTIPTQPPIIPVATLSPTTRFPVGQNIGIGASSAVINGPSFQVVNEVPMTADLGLATGVDRNIQVDAVVPLQNTGMDVKPSVFTAAGAMDLPVPSIETILNVAASTAVDPSIGMSGMMAESALPRQEVQPILAPSNISPPARNLNIGSVMSAIDPQVVGGGSFSAPTQAGGADIGIIDNSFGRANNGIIAGNMNGINDAPLIVESSNNGMLVDTSSGTGMGSQTLQGQLFDNSFATAREQPGMGILGSQGGSVISGSNAGFTQGSLGSINQQQTGAFDAAANMQPPRTAQVPISFDTQGVQPPAPLPTSGINSIPAIRKIVEEVVKSILGTQLDLQKNQVVGYESLIRAALLAQSMNDSAQTPVQELGTTKTIVIVPPTAGATGSANSNETKQPYLPHEPFVQPTTTPVSRYRPTRPGITTSIYNTPSSQVVDVATPVYPPQVPVTEIMPTTTRITQQMLVGDWSKIGQGIQGVDSKHIINSSVQGVIPANISFSLHNSFPQHDSVGVVSEAGGTSVIVTPVFHAPPSPTQQTSDASVPIAVASTPTATAPQQRPSIMSASDASFTSLKGRGVSILTPDQVPGGIASSSFKTIAVENKLFDVKKVKEVSAKAAAARTRRPPLAESGTLTTIDGSPQSSLSSSTGMVFNTGQTRIPGNDATSFTAPGALDTTRSGASTIQAFQPTNIPSSNNNNINVDIMFKPQGNDPNSASKIASIQTDGSFLGLPSAEISRPSTVSQSARTKFIDQASLLAMVSEQISKRTPARSPSSSLPTPSSPMTTGRMRPTSPRMRPTSPRGRMPFTGPASAWDRKLTRPRQVDVNIVNTRTRPVQRRVELPPPPFDPNVPAQRSVGPVGLIDPFPTPSQIPMFNPNFERTQAPNIGFDPSLPVDFTLTTVPPARVPNSPFDSSNNIMNATSFFLDPIPTEPAPTNTFVDIRSDTTGQIPGVSFGQLGVSPDIQPVSDPSISTVTKQQNPLISDPTIGTPNTISPTMQPNLNIPVQPQGTINGIVPVQNAIDVNAPPTPTMLPVTQVPIVETTPSVTVTDIITNKSSGSSIINIGIIDVTNATVSNDTMGQYDMTPFQNNENWAIFDPATIPTAVNFSDYGPILDLPVDTNQISFTSNSDTGFNTIFSQANPPAPGLKPAEFVQPTMTEVNSRTTSLESNVVGISAPINVQQPNQWIGQQPSKVVKRVLNVSSQQVNTIDTVQEPFNQVVGETRNNIIEPTFVQVVPIGQNPGDVFADTANGSQAPVELPPPPPPF